MWIVSERLSSWDNTPADSAAVESADSVAVDSVDSVLVESTSVESQLSQSFMASWQPDSSYVHSSHWQGFVGRPHVERLSDNDGVVALTGVMFALLAVFVYFAFYRLKSRAKDFFKNDRQFRQQSPESNIGEVRNTLLLTAILSLSLSLIFVGHLETSWIQNTHLPLWELLVTLFLAIYAIIYLKGLIYAVVNWVFFSRERNLSWISSYFFLTSLLSFVIFPLSLVDIYADINAQIVPFCLLFLLILYKFLLFFKFSNHFKLKKYGYVLIFLYLCAVEILPSLILWHFLDKNGAIL